MVSPRIESHASGVETQDLLSTKTKRSVAPSDRAQLLRPEHNDPFGVYQAISAAAKGVPWWRSTIAAGSYWGIVLVALLPLPLSLIAVWAVAGDVAPPWARATGGIFLLWMGLFVGNQLRLLRWGHRDRTMQPTTAKPGKRGSVIVIGAGPAGLATVKECAEQGLDVRCFERQSGVGGVFRFNREFEGGCWPSVRLTTSPWVTAFSDFPPESESSRHQTAGEYVAYLEQYVQHFHLRGHLHFNQTVKDVKRLPSGQWQVTVLNRKTGDTHQHQCDRVAICVGQNLHPKRIDLPGKDTFSGTIRHSATYTGPKNTVGKRVIVVGLGESAVDIATELARTGRETYLSFYRGKLIIPRVNPLNGVANDYDTNRIRHAMPAAIRNWFMTFERKTCSSVGKHTPESAVRARLQAISQSGPTSQTVTKSDDFVHCVLAGQLSLRREIVRFEKDAVIFSDGVRQPADEVIFAHGYVPSFPFLTYPDTVKARHPGEMLFNMFHPELGDSIGFCGFARPAIGAIPPTGELQARLFALVAAGKRSLPTRAEMHRAINRAQKVASEHFPRQQHPSTVVNWIPYMDSLARLIGCKPQPWRLLRQPRLLWQLCSGPMTGAYYRVHGPGRSEVALKTLRSLPRMHALKEIVVYLGLYFWTWPLQLIHPRQRWHCPTSIL